MVYIPSRIRQYFKWHQERIYAALYAHPKTKNKRTNGKLRRTCVLTWECWNGESYTTYSRQRLQWVTNKDRRLRGTMVCLGMNWGRVWSWHIRPVLRIERANVNFWKENQTLERKQALVTSCRMDPGELASIMSALPLARVSALPEITHAF